MSKDFSRSYKDVCVLCIDLIDQDQFDEAWNIQRVYLDNALAIDLLAQEQGWPPVGPPNKESAGEIKRLQAADSGCGFMLNPSNPSRNPAGAKMTLTLVANWIVV